ncbi:MAG: DUF3592 domain-containing protein [Planctomycetaceae bacterium]|nr:DUF3592 domain-containing protein [Planctomycetaceae bacterium]
MHVIPHPADSLWNRRAGNTGCGMMIALPMGLLFACVGGGLLYFWAIPEIRQAKASVAWPHVTGEVKSSEVISKRDSEHGTSYQAEILYSYSIEGEEFENNRVAYGANWSSNKPSGARKTVKQFPVGKEVEVYYNPDDPYDSTLTTGTSWFTYFPAMFAGIFLLVGLAIFIPTTVMLILGGMGIAYGLSTTRNGNNLPSDNWSQDENRNRSEFENNSSDDGFENL